MKNKINKPCRNNMRNKLKGKYKKKKTRQLKKKI